MKVVQINLTCGTGSVGKICVAISEKLKQNGIENYILYAMGNSDYEFGKKYSNRLYIKTQALKARIFGNYGFNSHYATKKIIKELDCIKPDIVHLHNLHGHNCNLKMLFKYIKKNNIKIYWTFHDCWTFTGYCPYFDIAACGKWINGCHHCVQKKKYSWFLDRSSILYDRKKILFSELDLHIITPSKWLQSMTEESIFKNYPIRTIYNGINLDIFSPRQSDFRELNGCQDKIVLLGVAFDWGQRKGLDVFIDLAKTLPPQYQIVLVGTNKEIDEKLPKNIISIHRTQNQKELAGLYSMADIFVNPTREEVLGMVNIEALACGTPVITFNTGGSPECINERCGVVVPRNDVDALRKAILNFDFSFSQEECVARARKFCDKDKYEEYLSLYLEQVVAK